MAWGWGTAAYVACFSFQQSQNVVKINHSKGGGGRCRLLYGIEAHQVTSAGVTILDTLDTLWMMELKEEFQEARDWVASELEFDKCAHPIS